MAVLIDPRHIDWDRWCALFCEQFADVQVAPLPEDRWEDFADDIASRSYFSTYCFPGANGFDNWQNWASTLVGLWQ